MSDQIHSVSRRLEELDSQVLVLTSSLTIQRDLNARLTAALDDARQQNARLMAEREAAREAWNTLLHNVQQHYERNSHSPLLKFAYDNLLREMYQLAQKAKSIEGAEG